MNEFRKDYALNRWVIIAEKRKARPRQFGKIELSKEDTDYFAPGNEKLTPPEIGRVEFQGSWLMRWFANKFPAVALRKAVSKKVSFKLNENGLLVSALGYGHHEIIVETPTKNQLWDLTDFEISELLKVFSVRMSQLAKEKDVAYVALFKNHGRQGGTSLIHSHCQLITVPFIPPYIKEKARAYTKNVFDKIILLESHGPRAVKETQSFFAFCPYASRFNFESWIFPKQHKKSLSEFNEKELDELARVLKSVLSKLRLFADSYNIAFFYSPPGFNMRFHIEILPRMAAWAGFEYCSEIIINSVAPETAAKLLR